MRGLPRGPNSHFIAGDRVLVADRLGCYDLDLVVREGLVKKPPSTQARFVCGGCVDVEDRSRRSLTGGVVPVIGLFPFGGVVGV